MCRLWNMLTSGVLRCPVLGNDSCVLAGRHSLNGVRDRRELLD